MAFRKALPPRQRLPYQGSCLRSRLRGWTKDSLTGKLLLNSTSPSRLTPCHLPYRGEALAFRKALPPRQRLPYQGQRRRPPPAAETGSRCWGRGQQDASDSAADAGSRNPALSAKQTERLDKGLPDREALAGLNLSVTADAVPPPLTRGGLGIPQSFASSPEAPLPGELSNEVRLRGCTKDSLTVSHCWTQPLRHRLRDATSPTEGRPWHSVKPRLFARGSPTRGAVERSETERLDKGWPDRKPLTFGHSETGDALCLYIICPMTAA